MLYDIENPMLMSILAVVGCFSLIYLLMELWIKILKGRKNESK